MKNFENTRQKVNENLLLDARGVHSIGGVGEILVCLPLKKTKALMTN